MAVNFWPANFGASAILRGCEDKFWEVALCKSSEVEVVDVDIVNLRKSFGGVMTLSTN